MNKVHAHHGQWRNSLEDLVEPEQAAVSLSHEALLIASMLGSVTRTLVAENGLFVGQGLIINYASVFGNESQPVQRQALHVVAGRHIVLSVLFEIPPGEGPAFARAHLLIQTYQKGTWITPLRTLYQTAASKMAEEAADLELDRVHHE